MILDTLCWYFLLWHNMKGLHLPFLFQWPIIPVRQVRWLLRSSPHPRRERHCKARIREDEWVGGDEGRTWQDVNCDPPTDIRDSAVVTSEHWNGWTSRQMWCRWEAIGVYPEITCIRTRIPRQLRPISLPPCKPRDIAQKRVDASSLTTRQEDKRKTPTYRSPSGGMRSGGRRKMPTILPSSHLRTGTDWP